jgi:4-hydroxybenzoyl-CoA thioesterase
MTRPVPIAADALPPAAFRAAARIRFGDCDPAGIVFFPNWFAMANAAVEDFFDAIGVSFHDLHGPRGIGTGYAHAEADFFAPGLMGDQVRFTPLITRIGGASYATTMHIHRGEQELARLHFVTVCTDLDTRRAIPIPEDLRAALTAYQSRCQTDLAA